MTKLVIFGSSFVERLRKYCKEDMNVPIDISFCGKGGLRSDRMDQALLKKATDVSPDFVFIHLGGNDITATSIPREIYNRLCSLVDHLLESGVKKVFVSEIFPRGNFSKAPGLTAESFKKQRRQINFLLSKKFNSRLIRFKDIRFPKDFAEDLVHLDTGMKKYFHRLRRLFCSL